MSRLPPIPAVSSGYSDVLGALGAWTPRPFGWVPVIAKIIFLAVYARIAFATDALLSWQVMDPSPLEHLLAKLLIGGGLLKLALEIRRDPELRPRHGALINLAFTGLYLWAMLSHLDTLGKSSLILWAQGELTWPEVGNFLFLLFADPGDLGVLFLAYGAIAFFLRRRPGDLILLPWGVWIVTEILGYSPIMDMRIYSRLLILLVPLALLSVSRSRDGLSPRFQIGIHLFPLAFLVCSAVNSRGHMMMLGVFAVNISLFSLLAIGLAGLQATPALSRALPFLAVAALFNVSRHLATFISFGLLTYGLPGLLFQEIALIWAAYALGERLFRVPLASQRISRIIGAGIAFGIVLVLGVLAIGQVSEAKVFSMLGVRLSPALLEFAGNFSIAAGSILPALSAGWLILLVIPLWWGVKEGVRLAASRGEQIPPIPWPLLGILGIWHLFPFFLETSIAPVAHTWPVYYGLRVVDTMDFDAPPPGSVWERLNRIRPFPTQGKPQGAPNGRNIILIVGESMHTRFLSLYGAPFATQPRLERYRSRMRIFTRIFCSFPSSEQADFSTYSGLHSDMEPIGTLNPFIACPSLSVILKKYGYTTSYFYSGDKSYRQFGSYIGLQGYDLVHDMHTMPRGSDFTRNSWGVSERATMGSILERIREHKKTGDRFFLVYRPVLPHHPFNAIEPEFARFHPTLGEAMNMDTVKYAYLNQLLFMDAIHGELLDTLEREGLLSNTIVALVGDHGESLGEREFMGHGFKTHPDVMNICCLFVEPGRKEAEYVHSLGSQVDILPTILDLADIPVPEGEWYQGSSLLRDNRPRREFLFSMEESAVARPGIYDRIHGDAIERYDVRVASEGTHVVFGPPRDVPMTPETRTLIEEAQELKKLQRQFLMQYQSIREAKKAER